MVLVMLVVIYCKNLYYSGTFAVVLTSALTPSPEDGGREEGGTGVVSVRSQQSSSLDWTGLVSAAPVILSERERE